jgi:hypothetical protein
MTTKKKTSSDRRGHTTFEFVKAAKAVPEGIMTAVYDAVKTVKRGTVADIAAVAVKKFGLTKFTSQDPLNLTHVMLNRLKHLKAVRRVTPKVRSRKASASAAPDASLAG